ncbi:MAG TPA: hypothetical protein PK668_12780 [Myxococcota bacterium]|nr:hypothetical protein [Myxococcota bacterium]HRY93655.1 hypothetical protein [Myxococcota bacterium]HSA20988.1 hypothetical protein [Myxococcota bacterium]
MRVRPAGLCAAACDGGGAESGIPPVVTDAEYYVCHTELPSLDTARWPHAFAWQDR